MQKDVEQRDFQVGHESTSTACCTLDVFCRGCGEPIIKGFETLPRVSNGATRERVWILEAQHAVWVDVSPLF